MYSNQTYKKRFLKEYNVLLYQTFFIRKHVQNNTFTRVQSPLFIKYIPKGIEFYSSIENTPVHVYIIEPI